MPTGIPAVPRSKITFTGAAGAGKWATSVWLERDADTPIAPADLTALADALYALFVADALADWQVMNQASTAIQQLIVDFYHPSSNASFAQGIHTVSGGQGVTSLPGPASQSAVVTLYSAGVGKTSRGRMYWPATAGVNLPTPYVLDPTRVAAFSPAIALWLSHVDAAYFANTAGHAVPSVSSGGSSLTGGAGPACYPIVRVGVDTQPDRQEHRERGITYQRIFAAV